ncbi:hypothetical protein F2P81_024956 [Scophthalmus maximus]|uniref:Uncharacterized protein n=1 Tax=Scophthalmus maximus TaxID=52904 RepID=A0A6A4RS17_SCOMX|nr:hypothetical protein F2P81_024956 [Scophthalmus maximus]
MTSDLVLLLFKNSDQSDESRCRRKLRSHRSLNNAGIHTQRFIRSDDRKTAERKEGQSNEQQHTLFSSWKLRKLCYATGGGGGVDFRLITSPPPSPGHAPRAEEEEEEEEETNEHKRLHLTSSSPLISGGW